MDLKKNLKLTQIARQELSKSSMDQLIGGAGDCYCACEGSSSKASNGAANNAGDLVSIGYCKCWIMDGQYWYPGYGVGDGVYMG